MSSLIGGGWLDDDDLISDEYQSLCFPSIQSEIREEKQRVLNQLREESDWNTLDYDEKKKRINIRYMENTYGKG